MLQVTFLKNYKSACFIEWIPISFYITDTSSISENMPYLGGKNWSLCVHEEEVLAAGHIDYVKNQYTHWRKINIYVPYCLKTSTLKLNQHQISGILQKISSTFEITAVAKPVKYIGIIELNRRYHSKRSISYLTATFCLNTVIQLNTQFAQRESNKRHHFSSMLDRTWKKQ